MVVGTIPPNRSALVSPARLEALGWPSLDSGEGLLAPLAAQPLRSHPRPLSLEVGQVQAHWPASLPPAHLVREKAFPQNSGTQGYLWLDGMASGAIILAPVEAEPLLQEGPMVM